MMLTCSPNSAADRLGRRDGGFTLMEMMVALVVGSILAASLAGLSRTISPRVELRAAAERIAGDFERARLEARRSGTRVEVHFDSDGYAIEQLGLSGDWADATVEIEGAGDQFVFHPGPFAGGVAALVLTEGDFTARIEIGAATGRVHARMFED